MEKVGMFTAFKHYADFKGRARRKEYWLFYLLNVIVTTVLNVPIRIIGFIVENNTLSTSLGTTLAGVVVLITGISFLWALAIFVPGLAVLVRRLHDTDKSGKILIWYIISPVIAGLVIGIALVISPGFGIFLYIIAIIAVIVFGIALFVFTCQDSEGGINQYGISPKYPNRVSSGSYNKTKASSGSTAPRRTVICRKCGTENPASKVYCTSCGDTLPLSTDRR
ncbi:MAG: DUF805 domain-containing protein [Oscillospiraceae bacterium]|nr:DUF805 domain-containing protein [Oscillospiraceae bacterium]